MGAVLGIDAAWTLKQPSGVALVVESEVGGPWRLVAVKPSYEEFYALAENGPRSERLETGARSEASKLLTSSQRLCGLLPDLVAVDMPLARFPISGRRASDNAVSSAYGARQCGTHTPNTDRRGRISDALREGFDQAGYRLQTESLETPGLIEVYPHPALLELTKAPRRLCYKVSKVCCYWPNSNTVERRERLFGVWIEVLERLDQQIADVKQLMPCLPLGARARVAELKAFEDMLDAVVCAWVGICVLEKRAKPFGDQDSAIWIPKEYAFE